jgi:hypothetical protein
MPTVFSALISTQGKLFINFQNQILLDCAHYTYNCRSYLGYLPLRMMLRLISGFLLLWSFLCRVLSMKLRF